MLFILTAVGSGLGGVVRFLIMSRVSTSVKHCFPLGLVCVNTLGSGLLGSFMALSATFPDHWIGGEFARVLFTVGLCGGLTTFSTFSLETLKLLSSHSRKALILQIFGSVGLCLLAAWLGITLTERVFS